MNASDLTFDEIRRRLSRSDPDVSVAPAKIRAAVALVLRHSEGRLELCFIRRVESEGDRWSGDIAFPGGRYDFDCETPKEAACRETLEEVGLDLDDHAYLGRLDDLKGSTESVCVSAFVFALTCDCQLRPNEEVHDTRWLSFDEIADPSRHVVREFQYLDHSVELPAVRVFDDPRSAVLWGLSYRFLETFMQAVDIEIPAMPWREDL